MDKRAFSSWVTKRLVNPVARVIAGRAYLALLETTGRKSGLPRRNPIGNGLRGDTFWIVAEHGRRADYVRNLIRDPHVRVQVRGKWRSGVAHLLPDDDPVARQKTLGRPVSDAMVRLVGTDLLTVRIDLEPEAGAHSN